MYYRNICLCTHAVVITILQVWAGRAELQYSSKIQIQKRPPLFRNLQSFVNCSMKRSIWCNFIESIQHKLSSDNGLNACFSHRFPHIDGSSYSLYKLLPTFQKWTLLTCSHSFSNCTQILCIVFCIDKYSGQKVKMFPVNIASEETSK